VDNAGGLSPVSQSTIREQYDQQYRNYQANGGLSSFEDWLAEGRPDRWPSELTDVAFESYLEQVLGGEGSFSLEGREFDGRVGDIWYEAKSGRYWQDHCAPGAGFDRLTSNMGHRLSIARRNGATY